MASKDKYKSLLERYKQALIKNPKLNLSAYCRLNGVSVSGMHHYIEDIGQSAKSIRDAALKATEHQDCEAFVPFTADNFLLVNYDASQGPVLCRPTNNVLTSFEHMSNTVCGPAQDRPLRSADLAEK